MEKKYLSDCIRYTTDIAPYPFIQIYSGVGSGKNTFVDALAKGYEESQPDGRMETLEPKRVLCITSRRAKVDELKNAEDVAYGTQVLEYESLDYVEDLDSYFASKRELSCNGIWGTIPIYQRSIACTNAAIERYLEKHYRADKAEDFLWNRFDIIVVDAPCSGEGMFRKDPGAIQEWNESNLQLCSERQQRILADIWPCLKPSGFLVYSTCTYNPGENEAILERLIRKYGARSIEIAPLFPGIVPGNSTAHCYHFYPHRIPGEGFFTGVVQKTEGEEFRAGKVRKNPKHPPPLLPGDIRAYIRTPEYYRPYAKDNIIGVIPEQHSEFIQLLEANLHILYQGCEIAEIINRKSKPLPSLALWQGLNKANCALLDTDRMTALTFLKKEDIPVPPKTAEWLLVTYRGQGLGWCKHLGNRLNNYYPKEWRIRMTIE